MCIGKDKKDYARRDSNPGHIDGNDVSYPWTTRVFPIAFSPFALLYYHLQAVRNSADRASLEICTAFANYTSLVSDPVISTLSALEECSHWFIAGSNLQLFEVSHVVSASFLSVHASSLSFVNVLPRLCSSHHIVNFFALQSQLVFESLIHAKHIGTSLAKKAEVTNRLFRKKDVGTCWAK